MIDSKYIHALNRGVHLSGGMAWPYRPHEPTEADRLARIGRREEQNHTCLACWHRYQTDTLYPADCPECGMEAWRHSPIAWLPSHEMSAPRSYWEPAESPTIDVMRTRRGWRWGYVWGHRRDGGPKMLFAVGETYRTAAEAAFYSHRAVELCLHPDIISLGDPTPGAWGITPMALERHWRWFLHRNGEPFAMGPPCPGEYAATKEAETFLRVLREHATTGLSVAPSPYCLPLFEKETIECLPQPN